MTLIKIDRTSIKRNPNAGATTSYFPGPVHRTRTVRRNEGGMAVEERQAWNGSEWIAERTESTTGAFPASMLGTSDERSERAVVEARHQPIPEWSYRYVPTPVTCRNCGATFPHAELDEDSVYDGEGGDIPIYNICPKCGEPDCCDVEYEKIDDVIRAQRGGVDKG